MSGNRYFFDTNAIIALVKGNPALLKLTEDAAFVGISIITVIEFFSFSRLTVEDAQLFAELTKEAAVINLLANDNLLLNKIYSLRQSTQLKLPDAIIASSALVQSCTLVSNDVVFKKVESLPLISF